MLKTIRSLILLAVLGLIAALLYRISNQLAPDLAIDESRATVIEKLEGLQNLETARMSLSKILEGEQEVSDLLPGFDRDNTVSDFLFKDVTRMEVFGEVIAGFDLSGIQGAAVTQHEDSSISILLPQPQILFSTLTKDTRVYDKELGLLTKGEKETETDMRNRALVLIEEASLSQGILDEAKMNATDVVTSLFGEEVVIRGITFAGSEEELQD